MTLRPRGQTRRDAKILTSASAMALISWHRPWALGLGLALKMCYPTEIILVVSVSWLYHCNIHYKYLVKHSSGEIKKIQSCYWHCHHVFLFRNIHMWPALKTWPRTRGSGLDLGILTSFNITAFLWAGRSSCHLTNRVRALKLGWATRTTKTWTNSTSISTQRSIYTI